jgi:hypothetical protein
VEERASVRQARTLDRTHSAGDRNDGDCCGKSIAPPAAEVTKTNDKSSGKPFFYSESPLKAFSECVPPRPNLVIFGLFTILAVLPLLIDILVAITTTKGPLRLKQGFWLQCTKRAPISA